VVASRRPGHDTRQAPRFNPLHCGAVVASSARTAGSGAPGRGFNPLHCGAVVASDRKGKSMSHLTRLVSIPFIAGQWSLLTGTPTGRRSMRVSIPFIAGQWSLHAAALVERLRNVLVSIPFIAGQWSLPDLPCQRQFDAAGFNPLHCGAVVASRLSLAWEARVSPTCFNPLHCGAVVSS